MDLDTARKLVVDRLRNQQYAEVEEDGPTHVKALWPSGTWRRFHVRQPDHGQVQFPARSGAGTGDGDAPPRLFEDEDDPREFIAIVDDSGQVVWRVRVRATSVSPPSDDSLA